MGERNMRLSEKSGGNSQDLLKISMITYLSDQLV